MAPNANTLTYSVPRNPNIGAVTLQDVLSSGLIHMPLVGTQGVFPYTAWDGPRCPPVGKGQNGSWTLWENGYVFLPRPFLLADIPIWLLEKGVSTGISSVLGKALPSVLADFAGDHAAEWYFEPFYAYGPLLFSKTAALPAFYQALRDTGAFFIPYLDIVEVAERTIQDFFGGQKHFLMYTKQSADGLRQSFVVQSRNPKDKPSASWELANVRFRAEMDFLLEEVKWELAGGEQFRSAALEQLKPADGRQSPESFRDMTLKLLRARDQELERKGYHNEPGAEIFDPEFARPLLKKFAPTLPYFEKCPVELMGLSYLVEMRQKLEKGQP